MNETTSEPTIVPAGESLPSDYTTITFDELRQRSIPDEVIARTEKVSTEKLKASKPIVAKFITQWLLWLFVVQMFVFTVAYLIAVYVDKSSSEIIALSTEAILDGVQTIMPITTAFLGVAIGFYFRESKEEEIEEEVSSSSK